jgi:hypothetical protein
MSMRTQPGAGGYTSCRLTTLLQHVDALVDALDNVLQAITEGTARRA